MIESQLVLEWTADARRETELAARREFLLIALKERFTEPVAEEVIDLINHQESREILREWFLAAVRANSLEDFIAVLRR